MCLIDMRTATAEGIDEKNLEVIKKYGEMFSVFQLVLPGLIGNLSTKTSHHV